LGDALRVPQRGQVIQGRKEIILVIEPAQIRMLAGLVDLDLPDEDLEYLGRALPEHAQLVQPLARRIQDLGTGFIDDIAQW
jgi:hypothetical protein